MKNKALQLFFLLFVFICMPSNVIAQCSNIFQQGITQMKKKQYRDAIKAFEAAKRCDENLTGECDVKISECNYFINRSRGVQGQSKYYLSLDKETLRVSANHTNAEMIKIESNPTNWEIINNERWCKVTRLDTKRLAISCDINKKTSVRKARIIIANGEISRTIVVIQSGSTEELSFEFDNLAISPKGDIQIVNVTSNTEWSVVDKPEWVVIESVESNKLILRVGKTKKSRMGTLTIKSKNNKVASVIISQEKKIMGLFKKK